MQMFIKQEGRERTKIKTLEAQKNTGALENKTFIFSRNPFHEKKIEIIKLPKFLPIRF